MLLYDAHTHAASTPNGQAATLTPTFACAILNGTHPGDWPKISAISDASPQTCIPSYGLHPWYFAHAPTNWLAPLRARLLAEPHAQVGEIGLDRALLRRTDAVPIEAQLTALRAQLDLATALDRVATLHCVQAHGLLLETLQRAPSLPRLLLHSYSGSAEMLQSFAALGAYFSFGAAALDPRRAKLQATFRATPPERLLIETDTPADLERNHRSTLERHYWATAALLDEPIETLASRLAQNFHRLFFPATNATATAPKTAP